MLTLEQLLAFPLEAFLNHGKAAMDDPVVGKTAKATATEAALLDAETSLHSLREEILAEKAALIAVVTELMPA